METQKEKFDRFNELNTEELAVALEDAQKASAEWVAFMQRDDLTPDQRQAGIEHGAKLRALMERLQEKQKVLAELAIDILAEGN